MFTLGFGSKKLGVLNIAFTDLIFGLKIGPKFEVCSAVGSTIS